MIYYQINDFSNKKSYFFNKNKKKVIENLLPKKIKKISLGFPSGILFSPPLKKKIYAIAFDNKSRIQYFYLKDYKDKKRVDKFYQINNIVLKIKKILNNAKKILNSKEINKIWIINLVILLIWECHIRIGNEKYKKLYDTNGAITLIKNHINIYDSSLDIKFIGKKGEDNQCLINKNSILFKLLKNILKKKNGDKRVLTFYENDKENLIKYSDIYKYLKNHKIRSKDIRMVNANILFIDEVKKNKTIFDCSEKERNKILSKILKKVSLKMNHSKNILKKDYLFPDLINNINKFKFIILSKKITFTQFEDILQL